MPPYRIVSYELNMVYLEYLHEHEYIHENIRLLLKVLFEYELSKSGSTVNV